MINHSLITAISRSHFLASQRADFDLEVKFTYRHGLLLKIGDLALNLLDGVLEAAVLLLEFLKLFT